MTKIIELIITEQVRGEGTMEDRSRIITQLFTKNGELVAEYDAVFPERSFFKMRETTEVISHE